MPTKRKNLIQDKAKRINLKSKRTRTLLRKAIEVSQMCDLDIHITVYDRTFGKITEYNSTNADGISFSFEATKKLLEEFELKSNKRFYKLYSDKDYEALKTQPRGEQFFDEERIGESLVDQKDLHAVVNLAVPHFNQELEHIENGQF